MPPEPVPPSPAWRRAGLLAVGLAGLLALFWAWRLAAPPPPDFQAVRGRPGSDRLLLDRHGEPLHRLRVDPQARRLPWVPLEAVAPALREAVLRAEDRRFEAHGGVDARALLAAARARVLGGPPRGASTLTMQLAALLEPERLGRGGRRSLAQKLAQLRAAWALEARWSKAQILEAYLNLVPWRGELVGVAALARAVFGKPPEALDRREAALAAALLRAPQAAPATVARRACRLLAAGGAPGEGCQGLQDEALARLGRRQPVPDAQDSPQLAPHLARRLLPGAAGPSLRSSLDARLQRLAREALRQQLAELRGRGVEDGAVLILDNQHGEVLAWVGSSGEDRSRAAEVDGVLARRQAGSTLKPFLYALAFEQRWLSAASRLEDRPLDLAGPGGLYQPQNHDRRHHGWVSARVALGSSLNVPAVRLVEAVSPTAFHARLLALGMALPESGGHYGPSLALGSAEVSLLELAQAYRSLARGGRPGPLRWQPVGGAPGDPPPSDPLGPIPPGAQGPPPFEPAVAWLLGDILADPEARALGFGLDTVLTTRHWTAVKTGTSKDLRDNWCVGYSRRHTVAVWVGNASGQPMRDVSGLAGAAPAWRSLMDALHRLDPDAAAQAGPPPPAPGLEARTVTLAPAAEPPRREWFLPGTPEAGPAAPADAPPRIASPADGSLHALDPDIPPAAQALHLQADPPSLPGWRWRLDGRILGPVRTLRLPPRPGEHRLELLDPAGAVRATARFTVRDPRPAPPLPRLPGALPS